MTGTDNTQFNNEVPENLRVNALGLLHTKYKNLNASSISTLSLIPLTIHHIWLVDINNPRPIKESDLKNLISTAEKLKLYPEWDQILWVNSKLSTKQSLSLLKNTNITINNIRFYKKYFSNFDLISKEIEAQSWGTASDILRYDIIYEFGGVYADMNYNFVRIPVHETQTYHFFGTTLSFGYLFAVANYMFGASPLHPIISETQALVRRNFVSPPEYLQEPSLSKKDFTYLATAAPLGTAYLKKANQGICIDVVYPINNELCPISNIKDIDNSTISDFFLYHDLYEDINESYFQNIINDELCLEENRIIGRDPKGAETWLVPQGALI